jgi:hypothetical protein
LGEAFSRQEYSELRSAFLGQEKSSSSVAPESGIIPSKSSLFERPGQFTFCVSCDDLAVPDDDAIKVPPGEAFTDRWKAALSLTAIRNGRDMAGWCLEPTAQRAKKRVQAEMSGPN